MKDLFGEEIKNINDLKHNKKMEYVLNLLEKDKAILEKCLNEWESKEYPSAKKERESRLEEIKKAINILINLKIKKTEPTCG